MEVKSNNIPQGEYGHKIVNPWQQDVPSEIIIAICDTKAAHGSYDTNGLYFEHSHLRYIKCEWENEHLQNSPINVRYGITSQESDFAEGYNSLRGFGGIPNVVPFNYSDYFNGLVMYRFTLEEDQSGLAVGQHGSVLPLKRTGQLVIHMSFEKPTDSPKTVYMFGLFATGFSINSNRTVKRMYP